jgi:perosamine synthetase
MPEVFMDFIPVSEPLLGKEEEELVLDCIRTGWISSEGKYVRELEQRCADYSDMKEGIAVCNGTAALNVAVAALDLPKGSEVILPSFTIISCVLAIIEAGLKPVLVDADADTWCMDVTQLEKKITQQTKAIMVVHIYGHPVDMDPVFKLAKEHGLLIIEDAAEAQGAQYKGMKCGGLSDISIMSFYANKLITTGEGGMILTKNPTYAKKARSLRNLCFKPEKKFFHTEIGHNYRLSNIQAAIGVAQIKKIEQFIDRKIEMAKLYHQGLQGLPIQLPIEKKWAKNIYWMYSLTLNNELPISRTEFSNRMHEKNIQTRPFFIGLHEQPVLKEMGHFNGEQYPVCERISQRGLYLPSGQAITNEQIKYIIKSMKDILQEGL